MSNNRNGYNRRTTRRAFTGLGMIVALVASSTLVMQVGTCVPTPTEPLAVTATATPAGTTAPTTVALSATATGGSGTYTYNWVAVPAVTIAAPSAASTTATVATGGTYSFTVTVSDGVSTVTATKAVTINAPTPPAITVAASGPSTATGGTNVTLTAIPTGGTAPVSFAWEITSLGTAGSATLTPADGISQAIIVAFSTDASGDFAFQVTATDAAAQTASAAKTVTVTPGSLPASTTFTLGTDNLVGTTGDDVFSAPLGIAAAGAVMTLQDGDKADGLAGNDTLNAFVNAAGPVTATLANIETLNFTNVTAAGTVNATNFTGATSVNSVGSTQNLTVNNIKNVVNAGISNSANNLAMAFLPTALVGTADALTFTASDAGTNFAAPSVLAITSGGAANTIETLNISSVGSVANFVSVTDASGTSLRTVNISGSVPLTVVADLPIPNQPIAVNVSSTARTSVSVPAATVTYTGGTSDDTVIFNGASYTTADIVNGGTGYNTLGLTSANAIVVANQTNVSNIQRIQVTNQLNGALVLSYFGAKDVLLDTFGAVALTGGNSTIAMPAGTDALALNNQDTGHTLGVTIAGTGTTDVLDYSLNNADVGAAVTITNAETVNLSSNNGLDGTAADGGVNTHVALTVTPTFGTPTLNIAGVVPMTFTGVITCATIDASTATGAFTMVTGTLPASGVSVKGGSGNDVLFGSAGNDILLSGGAGNDTITGEAGLDNITGGDGRDTFVLNTAAASGADRKLISDFNVTPVTGDILNFGTLALVGTDNFATAASIQLHSTTGNMVVGAAAKLVRVTSGTIADLTAANSLNGTNLITAIGGTITVANNGDTKAFAIADTSGNVGIYYGAAGANTDIAAGEITLVAVMQNVSLANIVFQNFTD